MVLRAAVLVSSLLHCSGESGLGTGPCPLVSACAWQGELCFGESLQSALRVRKTYWDKGSGPLYRKKSFWFLYPVV